MLIPAGGLSPAAVAALRDQIDPPRRRRRQFVAVLGAAGILAAGTGWLATDSAPSAPLASVAAPPVTQPQVVWVDRANITLVAINQQLDMVTRTEAIWNSSIAAKYQGRGIPAAVTTMLNRKALLEQQRTALQSQLNIVEQLGPAAQALADAERRLAAITTALAASPPGQAQDPDQLAVISALNDQQLLLQQARDAKAAELAHLQQDVRNLQSAPLPDSSDATTPVAVAVLALDRPLSPAPGQTPTTVQRPPIVVAGRQDQVERQGPVYTTGEPGHDPEALPRPSGSQPPASSSTGRGSPQTAETGHPVTDTVRAIGNTADTVVSDLADPGGGHANPSRTEPRTEHPVTNTVRDVGATADTVATTLTNTNTNTGGKTTSETKTAVPDQPVTKTVDAVGATADTVVAGLASAVTPHVETQKKDRSTASAAAAPTVISTLSATVSDIAAPVGDAATGLTGPNSSTANSSRTETTTASRGHSDPATNSSSSAVAEKKAGAPLSANERRAVTEVVSAMGSKDPMRALVKIAQQNRPSEGTSSTSHRAASRQHPSGSTGDQAAAGHDSSAARTGTRDSYRSRTSSDSAPSSTTSHRTRGLTGDRWGSSWGPSGGASDSSSDHTNSRKAAGDSSSDRSSRTQSYEADSAASSSGSSNSSDHRGQNRDTSGGWNPQQSNTSGDSSNSSSGTHSRSNNG